MLMTKEGPSILRVGESMLAGEIEYRKGNFNVAFDHLREAVRCIHSRCFSPCIISLHVIRTRQSRVWRRNPSVRALHIAPWGQPSNSLVNIGVDGVFLRVFFSFRGQFYRVPFSP